MRGVTLRQIPCLLAVPRERQTRLDDRQVVMNLFVSDPVELTLFGRRLVGTGVKGA